MKEKTYIVRWYVRDKLVHSYERTDYLFQLQLEAKLQKGIFRAGMGIIDQIPEIRNVTHYELIDKKTEVIAYSDKLIDNDQVPEKPLLNKMFGWIRSRIDPIASSKNRLRRDP